MTVKQERKISRTIVALGSTMLLFAAAALGVYHSSASFETLFDRNMLHQCNGPQRGLKLEPGQSSEIAALPLGLFRLFYLQPSSSDAKKFCSCDLSCESGNADLYMTDYEGYWIYPNFLNNWDTDSQYDCISNNRGNTPETCRIKGAGSDWFCYIMVKARTSVSNCTIGCRYV